MHLNKKKQLFWDRPPVWPKTIRKSAAEPCKLKGALCSFVGEIAKINEVITQTHFSISCSHRKIRSKEPYFGAKSSGMVRHISTKYNQFVYSGCSGIKNQKNSTRNFLFWLKCLPPKPPQCSFNRSILCGSLKSSWMFCAAPTCTSPHLSLCVFLPAVLKKKNKKKQLFITEHKLSLQAFFCILFRARVKHLVRYS